MILNGRDLLQQQLESEMEGDVIETVNYTTAKWVT